MNQAASRIAYEWIKENGYEGYNIPDHQTISFLYRARKN
jgi:hypothetical protein